MAKQIQLRRGTTAENNGFTGAVGEVSVDTDKEVLVVHDGVTVGGFPVAARANADGTISLIKKDGGLLDTLTPSTNLVGYAPIAWAQVMPPSGYITMAGQAISVEHPILRSIYGNNIPDLRGVFVRGWDNGRGIDFGRTLLSEQGDAIRNIAGQFKASLGGYSGNLNPQTDGAFSATEKASSAFGGSGGDDWARIYKFDSSRVVPTAHENRPKNIAFNYIVKLG